MKLQSVTVSRAIFQVHALTDAGAHLEFTRFLRDGKIEVYDYPKTWNGTPRFIGYLPDDAAAKLETIAWERIRSEHFRTRDEVVSAVFYGNRNVWSFDF